MQLLELVGWRCFVEMARQKVTEEMEVSGLLGNVG